MMLIKCVDFVARVPDIVDREVDMAARLRFFAHLMMCRKCRRYLRQFRTILQAVAATRGLAAVADFDRVLERVMDRIEKRDGHSS